MTALTIEQTAAFFRERDNFAILTHSYPDGDTVGSSAALCRILRQLGKIAHVLENPQITSPYADLHCGLTKLVAAETDTVVSVDVAAPHLLPADFQPYLRRIALRIDHHSGDDHFSQYELVDSHCGACTEIIYEIGCALDIRLDAPTADALYTGLLTDTSCFQFANTTAHTLAVASACVAAGARNFEIYQTLFEGRISQRLQLQSYIGENREIFAGGKLALVSIPLEVQTKIGANREDLNNILNFLQALTKASVAATLLEVDSCHTRLSVRCVPGLDCSGVAAAFGGGGHKVSAGANMTISLAEAQKAVKEEMRRQFGEIL